MKHTTNLATVNAFDSGQLEPGSLSDLLAGSDDDFLHAAEETSEPAALPRVRGERKRRRGGRTHAAAKRARAAAAVTQLDGGGLASTPYGGGDIAEDE